MTDEATALEERPERAWKVQRKVTTAHGDELVVRVTPEGIYTREKGRRTWYGPVPWGHIHLSGARMRAASDANERAVRKQVRRIARNLLKR